jgi:predicted transcriptional regulator
MEEQQQCQCQHPTQRTFWQWLACSFGAHAIQVDTHVRCTRPNCYYVDL